MHNRWDTLTMLHWSYEPAVVQRLLPPGLQVETWDDRAWVGLVPFFMQVRAPGQPWWPRLGRFAETNVRTYVRRSDGCDAVAEQSRVPRSWSLRSRAARATGARARAAQSLPANPTGAPSAVRGADGNPGVWFFSLEAARLGVVAIGRGGYGVPYFWAKMRREQRGDVWEYESSRRWPGPRRAHCRVRVKVGAEYGAGEATDFEHWLSARWRLYGELRSGRLITAEAHHERWPLFHAEVLECDQSLLRACGLPAASAAPIAHWSPRVTVRIGRPGRC